MDDQEAHGAGAAAALPPRGEGGCPPFVKSPQWLEALRCRLSRCSQGHALAFWDALAGPEREALARELSEAELEALGPALGEALGRGEAAAGQPGQAGQAGAVLEPLPAELCGSSIASDPGSLRDWEEHGLLQVAEGRVAIVLLAGGQGTRLGVPYPKGLYDVGLPSHKPLLQLQAQRILRLQRLAEERHGKRGALPWYIMTSGHTREPMLAFLRERGFLGLCKDDVRLFEQRQIPALTPDGKVILETRGRLARAPDGNGGLYRALGDSGVLADMEARGVRYVHAYCVDNILARVGDPLFLGFCVRKGADCGAKVVEKQSPDEAVGVLCLSGGRARVVEYTELGAEQARERDHSGRLRLRAGNICVHHFTLDFLKLVVREFEPQLPFHVAHKKIAHVDESGNRVEPTKPNGIKMEKFVFDVFPFAKKFVQFEVRREDEFSPLKNSDSAGVDCPSSSRRHQMALHYRWIQGAGGRIVDEQGNDAPSPAEESETPTICEISPLISYSGEGLESHVKGRILRSPFVLGDP
ncbi:UDP-N-acetylhexosamine pyrophosphorylase-like protein 1 [Petromyzon marinus]|uniref:UDP-N-acetylhexosamine pyrophosphorylase-like protein 1 n=1 Tax=Petromyzon marinus TaxID=7757 RepID=UPI003F7097D5